MRAPDPQHDPLIGVTVGNYQIRKLIGSGGMGNVYQALQPSIGAQVAIKVLAPEAAAATGLVDRFFAEARAVNLIRHENIVNIIDFGWLADRRPYIVMEHLAGASLAQVLKHQGRLPLGSLANLMGEVLAGLSAAHERSILHRDLKPDNIFVSPTGHATLLDFGIAKLSPDADSRNSITHASMLLGTPPYISPEHAEGKPIDARSDLYSIGVVLYQAVTGRRPFDSPSLFEILRQHIEDPPRPPSQLRPELSADFEAVILTALAKKPSQRFSNAAAMAKALASVAKTLPQAEFAPLDVNTESTALTMPATSPGRLQDAQVVTGRPGFHTPGFGNSGPTQASPRRSDLTPLPPVPVQHERPLWRSPVAIAGVTGLLIGAVVVLIAGSNRSDGQKPSAGTTVESGTVPPATSKVPPKSADQPVTRAKKPVSKTASSLLGDRFVAGFVDGDEYGREGRPANAENFDANSYLQAVQEMVASQALPYQLTMIVIEDVRADGTVNLTGRDGRINLAYVDTNAAKLQGGKCMVAIVASEAGLLFARGTGLSNCRDLVGIPFPRCTISQVIERAEKRALTEPYTLSYIKEWFVSAGAKETSIVIADDC